MRNLCVVIVKHILLYKILVTVFMYVPNVVIRLIFTILIVGRCQPYTSWGGVVASNSASSVARSFVWSPVGRYCFCSVSNTSVPRINPKP